MYHKTGNCWLQWKWTQRTFATPRSHLTIRPAHCQWPSESVDAAEKHSFTANERRAKTVLSILVSPGGTLSSSDTQGRLLQHTISWMLTTFEQYKQSGTLYLWPSSSSLSSSASCIRSLKEVTLGWALMTRRKYWISKSFQHHISGSLTTRLGYHDHLDEPLGITSHRSSANLFGRSFLGVFLWQIQNQCEIHSSTNCVHLFAFLLTQ